MTLLKGKFRQPLEALCGRESPRPAALPVAPPELVFWFGAGQEFGESLESEEGLGT